MIEKIKITSREQWLSLRKSDVTASSVAALLGAHPYQTAFGYWAEKSGRIESDAEESPQLKRGRLLEPVAIKLIEEERPDLMLSQPGAYYRDPELRLGATPDLFAVDKERGLGVIQIKSTEASIFRRNWIVDGEVTPPLYAVIQAITEAHLCEAKWAAVAAMTVSFGLDLHFIEVPIHEGIIEKIKSEVGKFWQLVESGKEPHPDYGRDGEIINRLYAQETAGKTVDLNGNNRVPGLLDARDILSGEVKERQTQIDAINTELKAALGDAETGVCGSHKISWKTRKAYVANVPAGRVLRVTSTKATKQEAA